MPVWTTDKVGRVKAQGKVDETIGSNFFFFLYLGEGSREGERATSSIPTASSTRDGGQPPGVTLGSPLWDMLQGYCPSGFNSSEMLLISLLQE